MTTRRKFLAGLLAASTTPKLTWADAGNPSYLAAAKLPNGVFSLFGLSNDGGELFEVALPARGHAAAIHPLRPEAVAFARRPGRFALVINCVTGDMIEQLDAPVGRHFYGHGAFVDGGTILCTTENDIETGKGYIGLWARSESYRRIGEFYSGGIGPHELKTMPDDQTLVIANGGIQTHPNNGREKLNLATMRPNLCFANWSGQIDRKVALDAALHQNSIRHLDVNADGLVALGMQWEGDANEAPPLLGLLPLDGTVQLLSAPPEAQILLQNYVGSVALSNDGRTIGITAPRGGKVHVYSTTTGFEYAINRTDISGISARSNGFFTTDGNGGIFAIEKGGITLLSRNPQAWDNHLVKVGPRHGNRLNIIAG